jgi:ATP-binding cassette subfamily B protein
MGFSDGSMWAGIRGNPSGAIAGAGNHGPGNGATPGGAPFAGIPPELEEAVTKLVATEPEHPRPTAVYTPRNEDPTRLTLSLLLRNRKKVALLSLLFLTIETIGFQTGPYLTQIGIDHGIGSGTHPKHHLSVIVICGVPTS